MDKHVATYKIINNSYFNMISASQINREDLTPVSKQVLKFSDFIKDSYSSQYSHFYDYVGNLVSAADSSPHDYDNILKNLRKDESPFDGYIAIMCVYEVSIQYLKDNPSSESNINKLITSILKFLDDPGFIEGLINNQKYIDFFKDEENTNSDVPEKNVPVKVNVIDNFKTFCLTQKNTVVPMVSTLALMSGLAVIYLFRK